MSTKYSASCAVGSGIQPRAGLAICSVTGVQTNDANTDLNTADVLQMVKIPKGATILDVIVSVNAAGLDTGATVAYSVGDTDSAVDDTDRYITAAAGIIGRSSAGGVVRMNNPAGAGYKFEADGTIDLVFTAGAGTNVATGVITLTALYTMDA
jgi:hypothetical protein